MQNVSRSDVELDMCPNCRGVWLDRGELEKLLGGARAEVADLESDRQKFEREVDAFHRNPNAWTQSHPYDADKRRHRYDDDYRYRKKKKGFDIFDIFD